MDKARYVTVYTDPIPLEVAATKIATADQMIGLAPARPFSQLEEAATGIAANVQGPELFENTAFSPTLALTQPGYLTLWAAPLTVLMASFAVRLAQRNSTARQLTKKRTGARARTVKAITQLKTTKAGPPRVPT